MGICDTDRHLHLTDAIHLTEAAIGVGRPVLGICLGMQLIAAALGVWVYASGRQEIGWFPVEMPPPTPGDGVPLKKHNISEEGCLRIKAFFPARQPMIFPVTRQPRRPVTACVPPRNRPATRGDPRKST